MSDNTQNHEYDTPEQGATDWHKPLNNNFEQLDADVEIRDRDDTRGEYDPKDGAKFLAVDTRRVYLGDGSEWNYFTTLGGIQGQIYVQSDEPDGEEGDLWIDTSGV